jgi:hypothetical protein
VNVHYDQLVDSNKETRSDSTIQLRPWEIHLSCSHPGKDPYKVVTQTSDMMYRIQLHPMVKMMVEHMDSPAPHLGATWDEQP